MTQVEERVRELGGERESRLGESELDADLLLERILADRQADPVHGGRRRLALGGALVAAIATAAVVLLPSGGEDPFTPPDASATLRKLSVLAGARERSEPPLKQGQYFYRRTQGFGSVGEVWVTSKGTGAFTSSQIENGRIQPIRGGNAAPIYLGREELTYDEMLDLPRDPGKLLAATKRATFNDAQLAAFDGDLADAQDLFRTIESFLVETPAPADLRAAFYGALARVDYVHLLGSTRTAFGRPGVAIGVWFNGGPDTDEVVTASDGTVLNERDDLIFDRRTGALIGTRIVLNGEEQPLAIQTGVVDAIGDRPGVRSTQRRPGASPRSPRSGRG